MNPCRMNRGLLFTLFLFLSTILPSSAVAFTERGFEVVNGEHRLPGTLCLPDGDVRAVVVFVHGSGPQDRDETLGPNRFFLSLAHAFAAEGIASLRYDKRTFVEKRAVEGFTYREESVDDAVIFLAPLLASEMRNLSVPCAFSSDLFSMEAVIMAVSPMS